MSNNKKDCDLILKGFSEQTLSPEVARHAEFTISLENF